jgi:hypothetical protein
LKIVGKIYNFGYYYIEGFVPRPGRSGQRAKVKGCKPAAKKKEE